MRDEPGETGILKGIFMDNMFLIMPVWLLKRQDLSHSDKLVFAFILGFDIGNKHCFASNEFIGSEIGVSEAQVKRSKQSLVAKHLLIKTNIGDKFCWATITPIEYAGNAWGPDQNDPHEGIKLIPEPDQNDPYTRSSTILSTNNTSAQAREPKNKSKVKANNAPLAHLPPLPECLMTKECLGALLSWAEFKAAKGQKYKSSAGWTSLIKKFEPLGPTALIEAIEFSMMNNYSGVFPPKNQNQPKQFLSAAERRHEAMILSTQQVKERAERAQNARISNRTSGDDDDASIPGLLADVCGDTPF